MAAAPHSQRVLIFSLSAPHTQAGVRKAVAAWAILWAATQGRPYLMARKNTFRPEGEDDTSVLDCLNGLRATMS